MSKNIYVVKPSLPPLEEYVEEIRDIWDTGIMTHNGPKHEQLRHELERFMDARHVTLFANGHLALELAFQGFGLTEGEVITTPFTFASTTQAILRNGLKPVFGDIRRDDFTLDPDGIEALITDRTVAIVPVHVYGNICDVDRIQQIADKHHLKVIYDAAHAFGEVYRGVPAAQFGDASMFSFHATKVLNTVEGGCLTYADDSLVAHFDGLKQFGQIVRTEEVPWVGTNAKMTEIHAAMGLCNLRHFSEYIALRKAVVERYRQRLAELPGIRLNCIQEDLESNYAYFPIIVEEDKAGVTRDQLAEALEREHIYSRKYFYPLCSDFKVIVDMGIRADVPVARYTADRVLTVPCYSDLALEDVDRICDVIRDCVRN